ncbi:MAG: family 10 glycosylhydrolase [Candidatus Gastranaerophilales bacterium]|nr:family 10 glycosylhydrolase [Candidatus Gastranaerophilales bacterium]
MLKKLLSILVVFIIFCSTVFAQDAYAPYVPAQNEVIFNQSMFRIDVVDPVASTNWKGLNYPGLRGANQLVVYSPSFGFRTNTNEFGTEAIVVGDTVVSLSGADSLIPANGFVISGHGKAKKWINENIMVGSKISLDLEKNIITSYVTSDTFLYTAKEKIKEVQNMMSYYSQTCTGYNSKRTEQSLNKAKDFVSKAQKNSEDSQKYSSRAIEYANLAMSTVVPYKQDELKGVWVRPTYYNKESIEKALDSIANAGINNVFIETYYHGKTIFPSSTMEKYGFIKQYEDYMGFDPLKIWITEAHKRGIKVHIWFQTFYVGNKPPETNPEYILAKRPEWANYQKKNADSETIVYSVSEHNGYFIDPANPEVQQFLYELLCEIITRYKPDGINLDYIRYPQSLAANYSTYDLSNWGYTKYARAEFQRMYGVDPIELKQTDALWNYWRFYRCAKVTNFVKRASGLCRSNNVQLTAVIFPNRTAAMDTKLQDWKNWSINNFVDGFTPLFLTCDDKTAINLMEEVLRNKSASTKLYAGLFVTFMNGSNSDLIKQIHAARRYALNGLIIFDYAHLGDSYVNTLTESVFKPVKKEIVITESYTPSAAQTEVQNTTKAKKKRGRRK